MGLIEQMQSSGRWLFKFRGQIPLVLFILAVPVVYYNADCIRTISSGTLTAINLSAFVVSIVGFLIRFYTVGTTPHGTSGRNTKEQVAEVLNTTGIYSLVRHPLYLGNYLIWLGIVIYTKSISFTVVFSLLYWVYYERIMMAEEHYIGEKFGAVFREWSGRIPAFIPKLSGFTPPSKAFSIKQVLRREYSGVLATVIGFVFVQQLIGMFSKGQGYIVGREYLYMLVGTGLAALVLRSLKHYTKVLD
jgi:protein-S-isoprenylcysteine O-methyltransferase Ste14